MIKPILSTVTIFLLMGLFNLAAAQTKQVSTNTPKTDLKFLEDINVGFDPVQTVSGPSITDSKAGKSEMLAIKKDLLLPSIFDIETAGRLQFKYALLLNTEVEMVRNTNLFKIIDEWLGTRYRLGGTSKMGIDCSALMQVFFTALYGIALPRTAKEQYNFSRRISRTELQEGDLVFFGTGHGVSHVGIYLQNNKFAHASTSEGVTISDLFDPYWVKRFVGVGRVDENLQTATLVSKP
jgi:lipoprotein Spr